MKLINKTRTACKILTEKGWEEFVHLILLKTNLDNFFRKFYLIKATKSYRGTFTVIRNKIWRVGLWDKYSEEAALLVSWLDFNSREIEESKNLQDRFKGLLEINSVSWFIPDFTHPYYGGIYTILRFADYLRKKGIKNQFVLIGSMSSEQCKEKISLIFPELSASTIYKLFTFEDLHGVESTDVGIATLWSTAYYLMKHNNTKRKFYFIQDYEPLFYPAGSTFAQVEATYRFGFYGITNTPTLKNIYREQYGGIAIGFLPCVDTNVFKPYEEKPDLDPNTPLKIFFYGRPGHPRNGFELGIASLRLLKQRLGEKIRIVSAGSVWNPTEFNLEGIVENLGLLSYEQTAELYRNCHAGLVMMFTRHPSYLPFELMASGCLVVTNFNTATTWFLKDKKNCLLSEASASSIADVLEIGITDCSLCEKITQFALDDIRLSYQDWDYEFDRILDFMRDPDNSGNNF